MGRKNHKKKISGIQNQDTHTLDNNNSKKRNLKLIYIIGVIVVLVVTFILFDNKSDTVSSIKQNSISNKSTKVSADNKQTSPIDDGQGPSIQFPEPSYDFGTISQGDKVSHTFIVRNAGNEPLKLIKAKGSWGCTAAVLTQADIPPGGEGKIEVTFNSAHKKGKQKKKVTVESNDPVNPKAVLYVTALIEVQFGFEKSSVNFGRIKKGDKETRTTVLLLKSPSKKNLLKFSSVKPYLTARAVEPYDSDQGKINVEVTLSSDAPSGRLNERITATLSDSSYPAANLRIIGTIIGNIELTPQTVSLYIDTLLAPKDQVEQKVRIASIQNKAKLQLLSVKDPKNMVEIRVDTLEFNEKYDIIIKPNENAILKKRNTVGEIKIQTNDVQQPEMTFRYNIIFPRR